MELYDRIWKDILSVVSFFSPALNPLQRRFKIKSKDIMDLLGFEFGRRAALEIGSRDLRMVLDEVSRIWSEMGIGKFKVESYKPLKISIKDCVICGQLPELGSLYECAFHKGFIRGLLSTILGRDIDVKEVEGFAGEAGTWSRMFIANIDID